MNTFPQYGLMPRWPENGEGFIHPEDISIVSRLIPSERVLRRESFDGQYYHYHYGEFRFRLLPCMWLPIAGEGLDIGDDVEAIGVGMERDLFVGVITGMYYVRRKGRILYRLRRGAQMQKRLYLHEHLRLLSTKQHVRPGEIEHPTPTWNGAGERITDW
ncbi:hypothetical protein [Allorhodopirellula heiligendammensis]|uniref:Uncharacterized protein n=1 Tax=Allorhodopirellula heiligendammensis TaxID=2714739 RepID=A0A5C6BVI1_9BACT|nr:hypothetical protein [Allorhodopirellula heiligendammensis]TWU16045.1 hypothetical protein Poly21_32500 [Allorhodopirellula heiligendammensis]